MAPTQSILLLWNKKARKGNERALAFHGKLRAAGHDPKVVPGCAEPSQFGRVLSRWAQEVDFVAVCGGDGTLNAALPALLDSGKPVLFVPSGTANNFARNLGLPTDLNDLCALLREPRFRRVDIAYANDTPFLTVCGLGLSTLINRTTPGRTKRWLGPLAFPLQLLRVVWNMRPFRIHLSFHDHPPFECRNVYQVSVCNGRYFATGLSVTEDATVDDGMLDVLCIHFKRWWYGFFYFFMFWKGTARKLTEVTHVRTSSCILFSHRMRKLDLDGDVKERTPAQFTLHREALSVVVGDAISQTHS